MSEAECIDALKTGWNAVDENTDLFVAGEMGIGNTTSAAAIANALYGGDASDWVGRGTGIDNEGLKNKSLVVAAGLEKNASAIGNGLEALRCLGGRELAAIAGSIASARSKSIPVNFRWFYLYCCSRLFRSNSLRVFRSLCCWS